ncbi:SusC/RagA family TonB-linked outer membrane protein [Adhaeribacter arboris]|uniref:SusC/RagA family TonB-linked outer membrane protein n=1 Tax=Adhaeribacter arboris TaxID=2072846 RepID=A0A2T2YKS4_9BACT|nr:SusC/RagA family TonB-linked outer membrane protein [Adhaeribacter arboris]PSR56116.1 SusC/RagA family TonB-linked outer membrane protein [Adhaeribacter arboris]
MKKILLMNFLFVMMLLQTAFAQDKKISGRVLDAASNQGLPGVTVLVKGTSTGTATDAEGNYSLNVPNTGTLVFSFIGYTTIEQAIGAASTVNVSLAADTRQLNEVVVTALGVERSRNSLPYAATQVAGDDVTKARNPNFLNSLSGKVSGVNIRQSNNIGGSTNVVIRGNKSLYNSNQALFVVDGVPISNANTNQSDQYTGRGGYDYGNVGADVNPDDIASVSILKGAAATALYGSRASNGVILITTKKGKKGNVNVTLNTGATMGFVDKSTFVKYQDQYGAGYGAYYGPNEDAYFQQYNRPGFEPGALYVPFTEDASYGAGFDPNLAVYQWNSLDPTSPTYAQKTPWVAAKNDPSYFLKDAVGFNNNITIDGGSEAGTFKLGYTNTKDKGILPNSEINKNMVNFAGSLNLTPKLVTSANINFTKIDGLGRYGTGYDSWNPMQQFRQWFQTNVDLKEQKDAYFRNKQNITWNPRSATDLRPIYSDNPYWVRYENYENDERFHYFGNVVATYKFTDWFDVMGRVTLDSYDELQEERNAVGSTGTPFYTRYNRTARETNYDLIANFNKNITEDFTFKGLLGSNFRRHQINTIFAQTNGGLVVPGIYSLSNSVNPLNPPFENDQRYGVDGYFASATFGFKELAFLDLTARRDQSSTLPKGNNIYYYPSAAGSFVFSELFKDTPWLSYGKARVNYAEVGNDAQVYSVYNTYGKQDQEINSSTRPSVGSFGSIPLFSLPNTRNNPELKPERTKSFEAGLEMSFLTNRVGFDVTYYKSNTVDQIIPIQVSTTSGFNFKYVNSGEVQNKGFEVTAFVNPIKNDNFSWTLNANWTRNRNKILSLAPGTENLVISTYQGGVSSNASVGQPFGTIRGTGFVFNDRGEKVIDSNPASATYGLYKQSPSTTVIADPNASWIGGVSNTLEYKGVSLYFLIDVRHGGQLFNLDTYYGYGTGMYPETAGNNDLGNPSRDPVGEGGGIIFSGVKEDGTPNDIRIDNTEGVYGYNQPRQMHVYDAGFVKLREASLTYSLPAAFINRIKPFKGVDLSLTGRNLWIIKKHVPYADPEDNLGAGGNGNYGLGYMSGSYPTTRNIGVNLRFRF